MIVCVQFLAVEEKQPVVSIPGVNIIAEPYLASLSTDVPSRVVVFTCPPWRRANSSVGEFPFISEEALPRVKTAWQRDLEGQTSVVHYGLLCGIVVWDCCVVWRSGQGTFELGSGFNIFTRIEGSSDRLYQVYIGMSSSSSGACRYVLGLSLDAAYFLNNPGVSLPDVTMYRSIYNPATRTYSEETQPIHPFLFMGTVLKKVGENTYAFEQTINYIGDEGQQGYTFQTVVLDENVQKHLVPIVIDGSDYDSIEEVGKLLNTIYKNNSYLNEGTFSSYGSTLATIQTIIDPWMRSKKPSGTSACAIAGGRRRSKKSRRTRSTKTQRKRKHRR